MTRNIRNIAFSGLTKLMAAGLGVLVLAPVSQAKDHDDVNVGVYAGNNGWGFGIDVSSGHNHYPPPAPLADRVWVEPAYRTEIERVWVAPVYRTETVRTWVAPVTRDVCERVWVEPVYEWRDVVHYNWHGRVVVREQVCVAPGHFEDRHHDVVVADGHWENVDRQVLIADGHWDNVERPVLVAQGHWEDRVVREAPHGHDHDDHWDRGNRYAGR